MMKVTMVLMAIICCLPFLQAQELPSKDREEILQALATQNEAWNAGDIEQFMVGYWEDDSLMFTSAAGITYGYEATKQNYYKRYPDLEAMGHLTFKVMSLRKLGPKAASLVGTYHLKRKIGDVGGYFTLIWRKIKGRWLIVADHTS